jgi:hypothetical protein
VKKRELNKRQKPWHKDEVSAEVNSALKRGDKADPKRIEGKVLKRAASPGTFAKHVNRRGLKRFPSVVEVPETLPDLPEGLKEFAFRYATEYRTNADWAHLFHVSTFTIYSWLGREDIAGFIAKIRQERRLLMAERLNDLEKKAFAKLSKILDFPLTEDSLEPIRKAVLDVLTLRNGKTPSSSGSISIIQGQAQGQMQEQELSLEQMQEKIEELRALKGDE